MWRGLLYGLLTLIAVVIILGTIGQVGIWELLLAVLIASFVGGWASRRPRVGRSG